METTGRPARVQWEMNHHERYADDIKGGVAVTRLATVQLLQELGVGAKQ
jgi:hypothetical protein